MGYKAGQIVTVDGKKCRLEKSNGDCHSDDGNRKCLFRDKNKGCMCVQTFECVNDNYDEYAVILRPMTKSAPKVKYKQKFEECRDMLLEINKKICGVTPCPICETWHNDKHKKSCSFGKLLKKLEEN